MKITQAAPEEILQLRTDLERMMLEADARAYGVHDWVPTGVFADFPITPGAVSFTWVDFWLDAAHVLLGSPVLSVATSSLDEIETLRARLGVDKDAETIPGSPVVALRTLDSLVERPFARLGDGTHVAEFEDDNTKIVVTSRRSDQLPDRVVVERITDIQPLIENWKRA